MGRFQISVICRGFHISHLVDIPPIIPNEWIIRDAYGITFACPSTNKSLGLSAYHIDDEDMSQGFIAIDKLVKAVGILPKHFDVSDEEQNQLESIRQYYKEIMPEDDNISEISNVLVEYMYSTWGGDRCHHQSRLQRVFNIK